MLPAAHDATTCGATEEQHITCRMRTLAVVVFGVVDYGNSFKHDLDIRVLTTAHGAREGICVAVDANDAAHLILFQTIEAILYLYVCVSISVKEKERVSTSRRSVPQLRDFQ
jgi:hypothetical protein